MKYLFALSNFGKQYEKNYHNLGLLCLEYFLQDKIPVESKEKDKYFILKYDNFFVIKSKVFMNVSSQAIAPVFNMYKVNLSDILVLHDDLTLKPFHIKIKQGGGNAGHNGLRSLSQTIGSDFFRIRIGIGHPRDINPYIDVSDYVLSNINQMSDWENTFAEAKILIEKWLVG